MRNRILTATISAVSLTTLTVAGVVPAALAESPEETEPGIIRVVPVEDTPPTTVTVFPGVIVTPPTAPPPDPVDPELNPDIPEGPGGLTPETTQPEPPLPPEEPGGGIEPPDLEWCFNLDNECPDPDDEEIDDLKDPSGVDPGDDEDEDEDEDDENPGEGGGENPDPGEGGENPDPGNGAGTPDPTSPGLPAGLDEPIPGNPTFTG